MIDNIFNLKTKPTASIFVEARFSNLNKIINQYLKSIVCHHTPFCNQCEMCQKIDHNTYMDLIILNGYNETIKKENILNIKNQFSHSSIEKANKKIYVLIGIENSTNEALNSLLKFIEDPLENTYCILTTRNIAKVIPTIRSRCHIYYLTSNWKEFNKEVKNLSLNKQEIEIANELFYDINELKKSIQSSEFHTIYNFATNFINSKTNPIKIRELYLQFKQIEYPLIKKIIIAVKALNPNQSESFIDLLNKTNLYLNKALIFNTIWEILNH